MAETGGKPSNLRRMAPTGALGVLWVAAPAILGGVMLYNLGAVREWLLGIGDLGLLAYVGVFVVASGFGLLPTYAQSILGGWVFGFWVGFPAALIGFTGGSVIGYLIARGVSRHEVEKLIEENPKARAVRDALVGHGFWRTFGTVALLRVPPNSPFALTNLVMGSTGVALAPCTLGTLVGMAPRTALAVWLAARAADNWSGDVKQLPDANATWIFVASILVAIAVLIILGAIANRAVKRLGASFSTPSGNVTTQEPSVDGPDTD